MSKPDRGSAGAAPFGRSIRGGGEKRNTRASRALSAALTVPLLVSLVCAPAPAQTRERDRPGSTTPKPTTTTTAPDKNKGGGRRPRPTPTPSAGKSRTAAPLPAPEPYQFYTLKLDAKGEILGQSKGEGMSLRIDLGGATLEMVKIDEGSFYMGTPESEVQQVLLEYQRHCNDPKCREGAEEQVNAGRPQHLVTVPTFFIGKFEVTQAQWLAVTRMPMVRRKLQPKPSKFPDADRPVEQVTWEEAVEFCARLSRKTGRTYRLPSEAEWEYACRAGMITQFAFGDAILPDFINFDGRHPYGATPPGIFSASTRPVGWGRGGIANAFGLYDTHGNVAEWCQDTWNPGYAKAPQDARAATGGAKEYRVVRGGSWKDHGVRCRSAARDKWLATRGHDTIGFRVVVS